MFTEFPFSSVYSTLDRMARGQRCRSLANRLGGADELVQDAILRSHARWERQPHKSWTISMLASGGLLDVAKRAQRAYGRDVADSETVELLAVSRPTSTDSDGLDGLMSGLGGRDREIAAAWSDGLQDVAVADRIGCSVKTVERTRKALAARLTSRL